MATLVDAQITQSALEIYNILKNKRPKSMNSKLGKVHKMLADIFDQHVIITDSETQAPTQPLSQFDFQSQAFADDIKLRKDPFELGFSTNKESTRKFHKHAPEPYSISSDSEEDFWPKPESKKSPVKEPVKKTDDPKPPEIPRRRLAGPSINTLNTISTPTPPPDVQEVPAVKEVPAMKPKKKPLAPKPARDNFPKASTLGNRDALPRRQLQPMSQDMLSQSFTYDSPETKQIPARPRAREVGAKQKRIVSVSEDSEDEKTTVARKPRRTSTSRNSLSNPPTKKQKLPAKAAIGNQLPDSTTISGDFAGVAQSTKIGEISGSEIAKSRVEHEFNPRNAPQSTKVADKSELDARAAPQSTKLAEKSRRSELNAKDAPQSTKIAEKENSKKTKKTSHVSEAELDARNAPQSTKIKEPEFKAAPLPVIAPVSAAIGENIEKIASQITKVGEKVNENSADLQSVRNDLKSRAEQAELHSGQILEAGSKVETLASFMKEELALQVNKIANQINPNIENIFETQLSEIENHMSVFSESNKRMKMEVSELAKSVENSTKKTEENIEMLQNGLEENKTEIITIGNQLQHLTSLVEKLVSGSAGSSFSKPSPVKSRKRKTSELPVPDFSNLSKEKDDESTSYSPLSNTGDSTDDIPIENLVDQKSQNEAEKDDSKTENKKKTSKKKEKSKKKEANKSIQAEKKAAATAVVSSDSEIDELWGENPTEALLNKSSQGSTRTRTSAKEMDIASQPSNTSMGLFEMDEASQKTLTNESQNKTLTNEDQEEDEETPSTQEESQKERMMAMSTPKTSSSKTSLPEMPISSIRPDNSTKSGKSKMLQSTVLPGGTAPEPGAYLDGIVKSEPGLACPSPIRSQAKLMPKAETANMIVTLSNANKEIKKDAKDFAKMFDNVSVWNSMSKSVTHVVACGGEGLRCNRTFKYIAGIAQGCWIVSPKWIKSCLENKKVMDEEHFEIIGDLDLDTSPNVPRISRIHKSRTTKAKSILSDFMIKTVRPYDMNLTKVHLYELLRNTGANIVEDEKMLLKTDLIPILIGNANPSAENENCTREESLKDFSNEHGINRISRDWVLDCILNFSTLDRDNYILSNE